MIYLDNAATTLHKPPEVHRRVKQALETMSSPGRGGHKYAMRAADVAFHCRELAGDMFHTEPQNVIFTMNATHGLNIAIRSLVKPGDRVVISGYEHNAVVRPLRELGANVVIARSELFEPEVAVSAFDRLIDEETAAVVCNHVSNVFGYILPIDRIAELCRERGVPLIVDASQSAGVLDLDLARLGAEFMAMPGHKGLYGPQGTGLLLCRGQILPAPVISGGTGSDSALEVMPEYLPDRLEAGTHNMPGIAGLMAGMNYVKKTGTKRILEHEQDLIRLLTKGLYGMRGLRSYSAEHLFCQSGVLSLRPDRMGAEALGEKLGKRGIAVRAGLHCSPVAHRTADTLDSGTVRVSVSAFNTKRDIYGFLNAVEDILRKNS